MGAAVEQLAQFVATTRLEDVPESVRVHARRVLLDTLGVVLGGSVHPTVQALRASLAPTAGRGATLLCREFPQTDPRTAALMNGIACRSIELCEGHRFVSCQAGAQTIPGILAVAEHAASPGSEVLMALIVGYDVAVRLGSGMKPRALAHQNGQNALLGAIAAGSRLRGLDARATSRALRAGSMLMHAPSYNNVVAGGTGINVAGGMSSFWAAMGPELALAGFEGHADAVEEALGKLVGDGFDPTHVTDELGRRFEIARNRFRLRACCNPVYPALDALEDCIAELRPAPDQVERIEVATYRFASVMNQADPVNDFAARYSFPHAAAATIVRGDAGHRSFTDEALRDPAIVALRHKVHMAEDPAMNAVTPARTPARVTLTLRDGRKATHERDSQRGDFQDPYTDDELRGKFRDLASLVLDPDGARAVEAVVDRCETWPSAAVLFEALRAGARA